MNEKKKKGMLEKLKKYKEKVSNIYSKSSIYEWIGILVLVIVFILVLVYFYANLTDDNKHNLKIVIIISLSILLIIHIFKLIKQLKINSAIDIVGDNILSNVSSIEREDRATYKS